MKTLKMAILSLSALIVFLAPTQTLAGSSDFGIRVKVRTPQVRVNVGTRDRSGSDYVWRTGQDRSSLHLSKRDYRMAARLADYTGISKHRIMKMRSRGHSWSEIGYRLDLPKRVIRAARSAKKWNQFMRPRGWCGVRNH